MDRNRINELKDQYWNIYQSDIMGFRFVWRELSRKEFKRISRYYPNPYDQEEIICSTCLLEPETFDFEAQVAGVATVLADHILKESGFSMGETNKLDAVLQAYTEEMNGFENQVSCIIHEAFPTLDIEVIEDWNLEKTLWYFSRAKYKLSLRGMELENTSQAPKEKKDMTKKNNFSGDAADFPELRAQKAFMEGKMK